MIKTDIASAALKTLTELYPHTGPHLAYKTPWELLTATVLAAQCTDARVNQVTPELFRRLPTPADFAAAAQEDLETIIHSTGFYRNKAKHLISAAKKILRDFGGEVPQTMEELLTLDGVARKTANIVLSGAFGINEGLAVDTHVARISWRLGLTESKDPKVIERDLMPLFPRGEWADVNHRMVSFGREICKARNPLCAKHCPLQGICPQNGLPPAHGSC